MRVVEAEHKRRVEKCRRKSQQASNPSFESILPAWLRQLSSQNLGCRRALLFFSFPAPSLSETAFLLGNASSLHRRLLSRARVLKCQVELFLSVLVLLFFWKCRARV